MICNKGKSQNDRAVYSFHQEKDWISQANGARENAIQYRKEKFKRDIHQKIAYLMNRNGIGCKHRSGEEISI